MKIKKLLIAVLCLISVLIIFAGCGKKDDNNDSTEPELQTDTQDSETEAVLKAKAVTLSGNADDTQTAAEPVYIESDKFIIYADAGVELKGDTVDFISKAMAALEDVSGMTYDNEVFKPEDRERAVTVEMQNGLKKALNAFSDNTYYAGLDPEQEKMCIFVVPDVKEDWAYDNGVLLKQSDLQSDRKYAVMQLAEMLCLRRGNVTMGPSIDGGMKGYLTQLAAASHEELGIEFDGYTYYNGLPDSLITVKNGSNLICTSHGFEAECLGFRFITFIYETYGPDIIKTAYTSCSDYREVFMGTHSGAVTMQKVVEIIKKNTSDNVFTDFYEWYKTNAERFGDSSYIEESTEESSEGESQNTDVETTTERDMQSYFERLFGK